MMNYYWDSNGNDMFNIIYMAFMLLLLLIGGIITVHYLRRESFARPEDDALGILKKRYANGEIDKKEFEEKSKDLKK